RQPGRRRGDALSGIVEEMQTPVRPGEHAQGVNHGSNPLDRLVWYAAPARTQQHHGFEVVTEGDGVVHGRAFVLDTVGKDLLEQFTPQAALPRPQPAAGPRVPEDKTGDHQRLVVLLKVVRQDVMLQPTCE